MLAIIETKEIPKAAFKIEELPPPGAGSEDDNSFIYFSIVLLYTLNLK